MIAVSLLEQLVCDTLLSMMMEGMLNAAILIFEFWWIRGEAGRCRRRDGRTFRLFSMMAWCVLSITRMYSTCTSYMTHERIRGIIKTRKYYTSSFVLVPIKSCSDFISDLSLRCIVICHLSISVVVVFFFSSSEIDKEVRSFENEKVTPRMLTSSMVVLWCCKISRRKKVNDTQI
jgi:hypothetical protein